MLSSVLVASLYQALNWPMGSLQANVSTSNTVGCHKKDEIIQIHGIWQQKTTCIVEWHYGYGTEKWHLCIQIQIQISLFCIDFYNK